MNTLHSLQSEFTAAVVDNNDDSNSNGADSEIEKLILADAMSAKHRLQIYHNNVYISMQEALKAVYPVVCRLVGDEFFGMMANEYIHQHPSCSGNLHDFGNQLPNFIKGFSPAKELVYLSDVAKLEWAYHSVFHAADSSEFDITALEKVDAKYYCKLTFKLNPASQLIKSPFPILRIWEANQNTGLQDNESDNISLDAGETLLLVIRRNFNIEFQPLAPCEYEFLNATRHHATFQNACDAAIAVNPDCNISQLLNKLILSQTITGFEIAY